jgi:hypothetical protein
MTRNWRYAPFSGKKTHWVQIGGILPYQTHILKKMMISNLHTKPTFSKWWWYQTSISNPHSQNDDDIKLHIKSTFSKWWWYQTSISKPRSQIGGIPPYQTHIPDAKCWLLKVKWWFHWRYTPWTSMGILHLKWLFPIGFRAALLT